MSTSSQTAPPTDAPLSVEQIDLIDAAAKIAETDPDLAELLVAVHEVGADGMHTVTQYPGSEPECVDDCPPCVALYTARVVAAKALDRDVAEAVALPPQVAARRPVSPNSRAARLAKLITDKSAKDAVVEPIDGDTLTVYVTPAGLDDWDWWLAHFHIPAGEITHRGSYSTAKGNYGRVKVLLTGHGVPALYAAEAAGGAR